MRIEEIHLKNFKSYGTGSIRDFDPRLNIIIGRNGHGKSNIHNGKSNKKITRLTRSTAFPFHRRLLRRFEGGKKSPAQRKKIQIIF